MQPGPTLMGFKASFFILHQFPYLIAIGHAGWIIVGPNLVIDPSTRILDLPKRLTSCVGSQREYTHQLHRELRCLGASPGTDML